MSPHFSVKEKIKYNSEELKQFVNRAHWGASSFLNPLHLFCFHVTAKPSWRFPKHLAQETQLGQSQGNPPDGSGSWVGPAYSYQCWPHSKTLALTESWHGIPYYHLTKEGEVEICASDKGLHPATQLTTFTCTTTLNFLKLLSPSLGSPSGPLTKFCLAG